MTWSQIKPAEPKPGTPVVRVSMIATRKAFKMMVSIASALAHGKCWDDAGFCHAYFGDGENDGKLRLEPAGQDGDFKIGRLKHCLNIRLPDQPWFAEGTEKGGTHPGVVVEHKRDGDAIVIDLPDWACRNKNEDQAKPVEVSTDDGEAEDRRSSSPPEPPRVDGLILFYDGKRVRMTATQAAICRCMCERFEFTVTRQSVHDELYSHDPNGGADPRGIDVQISKIRPALASIGLVIESQQGIGWRLVASPEPEDQQKED